MRQLNRPSGPSLRKVTQEELDVALAGHATWCYSDGKAGKRADLRHTDLTDLKFGATELGGVLLSGSKLCGADLRNANLQDADLKAANLEAGDLRLSNLQNADLREASLRGAKLQGCNLSEARLDSADLQDACLTDDGKSGNALGLYATQFSGANLSGAKLPESIGKFNLVANVQEASKNASTLFISMLAACGYVVLTVAVTRDAGLLTNAATSTLPVISTSMPIVGFYLFVPVILLAISLYFQLNLQRLWEALADLPAYFPDGISLNKKVYPWLMNGLVSAYFQRLRSNRPPLLWVQVIILKFLSWFLVPATLFVIWLRYLSRHDVKGTSAQLVILLFSLVSGVVFERLSMVTLRGRARGSQWKAVSADKWLYVFNGLAVVLVVAMSFLSYQAIYKGPLTAFERGYSYPLADESQDIESNVGTIRSVESWLGQTANRFEEANIVQADVSAKPATWTGDDAKEQDEIPLVKGAQLDGTNLRYVRAYGAFLVSASLAEADLTGSELAYADLRKANLVYARLENSDLHGAKLKSASLIAADLQSAKLGEADLEGADLRKAHLEGVDLQGANLKGAYLDGAYLQGANLQYANLQDAHLKMANLESADLSMANLEPSSEDSQTDLTGVDLRDAKLKETNLVRAGLYKAQLQKADISNANFQYADLGEADLSQAHVRGANFEKAHLREAVFEGAEMEAVILGGADLNFANFSKAYFLNVNFTGAGLWKTNFSGCDLTSTEGLSMNQFRDPFVIIDSSTKTPRRGGNVGSGGRKR